MNQKRTLRYVVRKTYIGQIYIIMKVFFGYSALKIILPVSQIEEKNGYFLEIINEIIEKRLPIIYTNDLLENVESQHFPSYKIVEKIKLIL